MKFWFSCFIAYFIAATALAETITIKPLLPSGNWIAGLNVPLQILGIPSSSDFRIKTELQSGTIDASQCQIMRDPFLPQNFLLRCLKPGTISLKITLNYATIQDPYAQETVMNYGPMTINKLDGLKIPDDSTNNGSDPTIAQGMALYGTYCISCHSIASSKKDRTANQIWAAIYGGESQMLGLQGIVTQAEVEKIATYLNSL